MSSRKRKKKTNSNVVGDGASASGASVDLEVISSKKVKKRAALRKINVNAASSSHVFPTSTLPARLTPIYTFSAPFDVTGISPLYRDSGDCTCVCMQCGALFWRAERLKSTFKDKHLHYHHCCENGRVSLPRYEDPPVALKRLLEIPAFLDNIRAYNQMFSMTSFGARIDDTVNDGRSPYVFKVSGQIFHWLGGLCPREGEPPRFLQLYIYDTEHEVENRMAHFGGRASNRLSEPVVAELLQLLDSHNELVKLFRTARDKCAANDVPTFKVCLYSLSGSKQHALPTSDAIGAIVFDSGPLSISDYDVVIEPRFQPARRINKLHPFMAQITPLGQLIPGDRNRTIAAKVYRKWVTYSFQNQTPTGYCCMLIEEMNYPILVNMRYNDKDFFDEVMQLNKVYVITNFSCHATTRWEKVLPGPTTLSFDRNTAFEELPHADFPDHYFQFVAYNQLRTRVPNTTVLADYIGCIDRLEDPVVMGDVNRKQLIRRTIDLTNLDGETIQLTLWNDLATTFDSDTYDSMEKPVILAVSSCRPKVYRGDLQLSCTQATHCYFNPAIPEFNDSIDDHRARFLANPPLIINRQRSPDMATERFRNRFTLQELLTHNLNDYRNVDFTCEGTIEQVGGNRDWFYKSCTECSLKVVEDIDCPNKYTCRVHGTKPTCKPTYCFKTIIKDTSTTSFFTFFSEAGSALIGSNCNDLITISGYDEPHELPPVIRAIEGQTHIFQFRYNPQSRKTHPEFIVTRLLDDIPPATPAGDASGTSKEVEQSPVAEVAGTSIPSATPPAEPFKKQEQTSKGKPTAGSLKKSAKRALFTDNPGKDSTTAKKIHGGDDA